MGAVVVAVGGAVPRSLGDVSSVTVSGRLLCELLVVVPVEPDRVQLLSARSEAASSHCEVRERRWGISKLLGAPKSGAGAWLGAGETSLVPELRM